MVAGAGRPVMREAPPEGDRSAVGSLGRKREGRRVPDLWGTIDSKAGRRDRTPAPGDLGGPSGAAKGSRSLEHRGGLGALLDHGPAGRRRSWRRMLEIK